MGSSDKNVITAKNGSVAAGGDVNVHRDLIINNELDPKILELVTSTVNTLTSQLEVKDQQLQLREEQTKQLSDAVAALAMEKDKPDAPPGLDQALTNLEQGDTESAKAIFQQLLDKKSAEAKIASQEAAAAAQHLGALALLDNQQEAVTAFERAIELDPENTEAQNQLGYIQKQPGEMRLQAVLSEAGKPIQTCFYIYYSEQDLDGNRKRLTYQCTTTANFTLEAGNYFIVATEDGGQASINQEFELKPGELINQVLTMQKN